PSGTNPTARVLLVTGHFPPSAGVGVRRLVQLCRFLAARGFDADVVTVSPADHTVLAPDVPADLPAGTRIAIAPLGPLPWIPLLNRIRARVASTAGAGPARATAAELARRREASGLPTEVRRSIVSVAEELRARRWVSRAIREAARLGDGGYSAVVSSGPPHFVHAAASSLARQHRAPLVVDLRDPWASRQDMPLEVRCRLGLALARRTERAVLRQAALVLSNNPVAREALVRRYPALADRIVTILNGSDETPAPGAPPRHPFRITYAGSLYHGRDPRVLFHAVRRAMDRLGLSAGDVRIEFAGDETYDGVPLRELARECGIENSFVFAGRLGAIATAELLGRSHVLVSLPQDAPLCIPAKLFEYASYRCWLLLFADPGTATEVVFRGTGAGIVAASASAGAIDEAASYISACLLRHQAGESPPVLNADGRFSRPAQLERLWSELQPLMPAASKQ
ncbi:MAG TPA: hypothetical protein VLE53_16360, partial [Gemmatimonadaceae bacterium]|nr:hypothetical protein [Gemmatimonadaceae bacterium]